MLHFWAGESGDTRTKEARASRTTRNLDSPNPKGFAIASADLRRVPGRGGAALLERRVQLAEARDGRSLLHALILRYLRRRGPLIFNGRVSFEEPLSAVLMKIFRLVKWIIRSSKRSHFSFLPIRNLNF